MIASSRGNQDGLWTVAASMDRYLQVIGQPQLYGTQYNTPNRQNTTMEPYNRTLISDAPRAALGVRSQAEQETRRQEIEARYRAAPRPAN
jgi:hypothetical protein